MNVIRYLTFEINQTCPNTALHMGKCPISHPERYKFSTSNKLLSKDIIMEFWRWSRYKGFRGIVLWHMYNEPVLVLEEIRKLMKLMRLEDIYQPFQLTTSIEGDYSDFDIVKFSDYNSGLELDNRIQTRDGHGKPYSEMPIKGWCARGLGWEIPIDNYGNWCLCCNDWRCEESIGNIHYEDWNNLYFLWKEKRVRIRWYDKISYSSLPRMCRACLDKNPSISKRGGI